MEKQSTILVALRGPTTTIQSQKEREINSQTQGNRLVQELQMGIRTRKADWTAVASFAIRA